MKQVSLAIVAMQVLPMGLRLVVVTDGELGATMEATEAEGTTLCRPNGSLAEFVGSGFCRFLHFNKSTFQQTGF